MKKLLKWLLILMACFALGLLALVVVLPLVFDPNEQKDRLENAVADATGRSFEVQGEIQWSVFPSIGFSAGPLLLGNADGFQSEQIARIGKLDISVQLMPLFAGRFEVGAVTIGDLELDLELNEAGENNWQDLVAGETAASTEPDAAGSSQMAALRVAGITLENGVIRYTDKQADLALRAVDISLHTSALEPGKALEAVMDLSLDSELWSGPMDVNLVAAVDDPLGAKQGRIQVQTLTVEGSVGENLPLTFELTKPVSIDPHADGIQVEQWKMTAGPAQLLGSLDVSGGHEIVSGRIDVAPFDARLMLTGLNGSAPQLANPESLARVGGSANWKLHGDTARLSDLAIQLDDSKINGQFELSSISSLTGTARLDIDQIDLDQYLAAAVEEEQPTEQNAADTWSIPSSNLIAEMKIGRVRVAGMAAENVSFSFKSAGTSFTLYPVRADLYEGQMNGGIEMRKGAAGTLTVRNTLKGISAAPLMADLAGQELLSGAGNLALDVSFAEPFSANPWKSSNGKLEFRFKDGAIHGVDVLGIMRQAAKLLGRGSEELQNQDPATDFSSLIVSAVIENGVMTTPRMALQSPFLRVTGDGSVNLADNSLDYVIEAVLVSTPAGQGGLGLDKLEGIAIPVALSGTLDQPDWRIDPAQLLLASQRAKLGEPAAQLLEAISGSGKDKADGEADLGQNLLNKLLNEVEKKEQKKKAAKPDNR